MTELEKNQVIDSVATSLLALACSNNISIPTWVIPEMLGRDIDPVKPSFILGEREPGRSLNLVDEYLDKVGYQFSWGVLSEHIHLDEAMLDEGEEVLIGTFEFYPERILKIFPNAAMVEDLFQWMYWEHPLTSEEFVVQESDGDWFVLAFEAVGVVEIANLRNWLAKVFIPKIWPDLLSAAMMIVKKEKEAELFRTRNKSCAGAFTEKKRWQLCTEENYLLIRSN